MSDARGPECGICTESIALKGVIESCEHSFCFDCILKWSEIESKCPICRRRFTSLKGTTLAGNVVSERAIPERDQRVLFENDEFIDWLESVRCSVCAGADAEDLLMLCDGCDQACHTYCAGLSSVPEDAWYCEECLIADSPETRRIHRSRIVSDSDSDAEARSESQSPHMEEVPETSVIRQRPRMLVLDHGNSDNGNVIDLTSPVQTERGGHISPPVLDLRSRLRSQLLNNGSGRGTDRAEGIGMLGAMRSPTLRSLGTTTVSDLTFATRVATGRPAQTPTTRRGEPQGRNRTFAQHAQVVVRERLSELRGRDVPDSIDLRDSFDDQDAGHAMVVPDGEETQPAGTVCDNQYERALSAVQKRMDRKFDGILLPPGLLQTVETSATELLLADCERWSIGSSDAKYYELVDDVIDEALRNLKYT